MTETYFALGSSLSNMVNIETLSGGLPPDFLPDRGGMPVPLQGGVSRQVMSGRTIRQGSLNGAMVMDAFQDGHSTLNSLLYAMYGNLTTASKRFYFSAPDSSGFFSPFLGYIVNPYLGQTAKEGVNNTPYDLIFPLTNCILQSVNKAANYTRTTSERFTHNDTSSGNITDSLPAVADVSPFSIYSGDKTSAAHSYIIDPDGSEKINGSSTLTLTAQYARVDFYTDGVGWFTI